VGIAEMEAQHDQLAALDGRIKSMVSNREFPAVFGVCENSFPLIVPAIKYRRKRDIQPEIPRLLPLTVLSTYAPLLFEHARVESLLDFVKATRLLSQQENGYLQLAEGAVCREEVARAIWNHLECQPDATQRDICAALSVPSEVVREVAETWEQLGVVERVRVANTYALRLRTGLDVEMEGICPACGVHGKGRKEVFFKRSTCRRCGSEGFYHINYAGL
jgi:hypothetical protein